VLDVLAELDLEYDLAPARPGEIRRSCLESSAARGDLGWQARVPLADGLRRTLESLPRATLPS
jgi:UDP-glucose 4-epimerase